MSALVSESSLATTSGLFLLNNPAIEADVPIVNTSFTRVLQQLPFPVDDMSRAVFSAETSDVLPSGKALPLGFSGKTQPATTFDFSQLAFASNAVGLPLPEALKVSSAVSASDDTGGSKRPDAIMASMAHDQEIQVAIPMDMLEVVKAGEDIQHSGRSLNEDIPALEASLLDALPAQESPPPALIPAPFMQQTTVVASYPSAPEAISTDSDKFADVKIPEGTQTELLAFSQAVLNQPVMLLSATDSTSISPTTEHMSLAQLIAMHPAPQQWPQQHYLVMDGEEWVDKNVAEIVADMGKKTAGSEAVWEALVQRWRQPEARAQQLLRHQTSLGSEQGGQRGLEIALPSSLLDDTLAKLPPESLKLMQSFLGGTVNQSQPPAAATEQGAAMTIVPSEIRSASSLTPPESAPMQWHRPVLQQQLEERIQWMLSRGVQRADIRIDPPELGTIHIRVAQQGEQTHVVFTSHHAAVRDALENTLPRLREMFEQQGLTLAQSDVRDQGGQSQRQAQQYDNATTDNASQPVEALPTLVTQRMGLVDTHA